MLEYVFRRNKKQPIGNPSMTASPQANTTVGFKEMVLSQYDKYQLFKESSQQLKLITITRKDQLRNWSIICETTKSTES